MFGYQEIRNLRAAPTKYDGAGIWLVCPECGLTHERLNDPEFDALLDPLCVEIGDTTREACSLIGLKALGGHCTIQPDKGQIVFTSPDGRTAMARYGIVASWNSVTHSWLWAWGFPETWNVPDACLSLARGLRARADANDWRAVSTRLLRVNRGEALRLASLAAHVRGYPMVHRAQAHDRTCHFLAIGQLHWLP